MSKSSLSFLLYLIERLVNVKPFSTNFFNSDTSHTDDVSKTMKEKSKRHKQKE